MQDSISITYTAVPTLAKFHKDPASRRFIMGPYGSGKSVGCCMEILRLAMSVPAGKNGVRASRWAVVRRTYRQLESTTILTWSKWIPPSLCKITYGSPIMGRGKFNHPSGDGTVVQMDVMFFPLESQADLDNLLSLELTGAFLNEVREMDKEFVDKVYDRCGRYPEKGFFVEGNENQTAVFDW